MKDLLQEAYESMYRASPAPLAPTPVKPSTTPTAPPAPRKNPNPFAPRPGRKDKPMPKPKAASRKLNNRLRGICDAAAALVRGK